MRRIGVLYNPLSDISVRVSFEVAEWLSTRGLDVWRGLSHEGRANPAMMAGMDLLIALGGDGTVLRAARLALDDQIPVLAIALGHLSFMAELSPDELYDGIETLLRGGGWHDERTLIEARLLRPDGPEQRYVALNEIVLTRGEPGRVVLVDVEIYDNALTTYHADGVIVATATGSTAYALAAGGPIVDPRSRSLVLVPVAAHLTHLPSLVLDEDAIVRLRLRSRHPAQIIADGRDGVTLHDHDLVEVRRSHKTCIFARVHPPSTFYTRLARRLRRAEE